MRQNSVNHLLHSVSTDSTNRFKSIMNSPNFGNQQILLQSCCFFDSERSQTPHASNTIIKDFTYNEDTHILGIMPYLLNKYSNCDLSSIIKSSNYYVIWTAPSEHEIGIWNNVICIAIYYLKLIL